MIITLMNKKQRFDKTPQGQKLKEATGFIEEAFKKWTHYMDSTPPADFKKSQAISKLQGFLKVASRHGVKAQDIKIYDDQELPSKKNRKETQETLDPQKDGSQEPNSLLVFFLKNHPRKKWSYDSFYLLDLNSVMNALYESGCELPRPDQASEQVAGYLALEMAGGNCLEVTSQKIIKTLILEGFNINHQDSLSQTLLHKVFSDADDVDFAQWLVDHGGDLYRKDRTELTPLDVLARRTNPNRDAPRIKDYIKQYLLSITEIEELTKAISTAGEKVDLASLKAESANASNVNVRRGQGVVQSVKVGSSRKRSL